MDLPDGSSRHRFVNELGEQLVDGSAEVSLQDVFGQCRIHRRCIGLQSRQRGLIRRKLALANEPASTMEKICPAFISTPLE